MPSTVDSATPVPDLAHPKVLSLHALLEQINPLRASKRIVFTNGCFDIMHPGHVNLLARAKSHGDILILGLNSDISVKRQQKGPERPINSFPARAFVLAHLESIDFITEFTDDTPLALIEAILPHVLVKGGDWPLESIVGNDIVTSHGGQVLSLPLLPGFSTTALVQKIRATTI